MSGLKTRVEYTSTDTSAPFRLTAVVGAETAAINSRGWYYITDKVDVNYSVLVEGTITSEGLWIETFHENNASGFYFENGVFIMSAFDEYIFNSNLGGMLGQVMAGQSNLVGHNGEDESAGMLGYDPILDVPDANILQYRKSARYTLDHSAFEADDTNIMDRFVIATEPLDHATDGNASSNSTDITGTTRPTSAGPCLTFAKAMSRGRVRHTNARTCILPCGHGSTAFTQSSQEWATPSGSMYLYTVLMINEFLAAHPDNEIEVIVLQQGESDTLSGTLDPGEWQAAAQGFIDALRDGTGITFNAKQSSLNMVPFIIGGIRELATANGNQIREDMQALADANHMCVYKPVNNSWTYAGVGNLHTDAAGQRERGLQFYEAYLEAVGYGNRNFWAQRPLAMVNPLITEQEEQLTVTWDLTPDIDEKPEPIIDYQLRIKPSGGSYGSVVTKTNVQTSHIFTGLTNGIEYEVELRGRSAVGFSNESLLTETPLLDIVPSAPANFAVADGSTQLQITWDALVFDPVVTSYVIQVRETGVGTFGVEIADIPIASQATVSHAFTAPAADTDYDFRMYAINSIGNGTFTSVLTEQHNASPTLALSPIVWFRKGIGQSVNAPSVDWLDQSGNGFHAFPVASRGVTLDGGAINLRGNDTDGRLEVPTGGAIPSSGDWTFIVRTERKSNAANEGIYFNTGNAMGIKTNSGFELRMQGNSSISDVHTSTGDFFPQDVITTMVVTFNASTLETKMYDSAGVINSTQTAMAVNTNTTTGVFIGALSSSSSLDLNGLIYDIVLIPSILSQADMLAVIGEFPA
ncbi:MAG: hypothetical protein COB09_18570 [Thalassobium sp.]|nr:MAG: hypothetical protein COB09_18570 [Thalassobium sp.]